MNFCYCGHSEDIHDIDEYKHRCLFCGCPVFERDSELTLLKTLENNSNAFANQLSLDSLSGMLDSVSL